MEFVAFDRPLQGTGASRRLRNTGKTPGIVYGGGEPKLIELDHNALWFALKKEAFHATILDMKLNNAVTKVVLRDVQYHPFKPMVLHIDFQRVDANTMLTRKVPVHYKGEESSPAVKTENCLVNHVVNELELRGLPADLPESVDVDLSNLKKGKSLHLSDIALPKGVKALTHGRKDPVLVAVIEQKAEEEATPAAAAPAADAKGKGKAKK